MAGSLNPLPALSSLFDTAKPRSVSPDAVKQRRALADALAQEATRPGAGSLYGAIAKGIDGLHAAYQRGEADKAEQAGQREVADLLGRLGPGGGQPAPMAAPGGMPAPVSPGAYNTAGKLPSFAGGAASPGRTSPGEVYSGLVARGVPSMVAAGMTGNIGAESDFRLSISDNRGEGSTGLIQARGPRLTRLQQMGAETGRDPFSLDNQLDHIVSEFQGPEAKAFQLAQSAKSPGEAAIVLAKHYERPAAWALRDSAPKRAGLAESVFQQSQADTPVAGGQPVGMTAMGDQDGTGYFIPPAPEPMPTPTAPPAVQSIEPPAVTLPEITVDGGPAGMPMPMPPPRPIDAELFAPAGAPVAQPSTAQAPMQPEMAAQAVPLPPPRPADADLYAAQADMPAMNARPAMLPGAGIDPNSRDTGAGDFVRREGMPSLVGGLQDGLDRIFGGTQTQARLDAQARGPMVAALRGDGTGGVEVSPRNRMMAEVLTRQADPAGAPVASSAASSSLSREALAGALGAPQISPQAQRLATALDPSAGPLPAPGQVPPASVPQPTAYAQAPGQSQSMPEAKRRDLLALANNEYASPQVRQYALDQLSPKLNHVDMGDSIGFMDQGGNLVRSYSKTRAPMNVPQGNVLADPNTGREIYRNPKEPEQTPDQRNYAAAKEGGFGGSFNDFLKQRTQRQGQAVTIKDPNGNDRTMFYDPVENRLRSPEEMGAPAAPAPTNPYTPGGKGMTEEQAKASGYAGRMTTSHATINELETVGTGAIEAGLAKIPGANVLLSTGKQRLEQAQSDFINSLLRRESGAAINKDEFDRYSKQYFPRPGDKPEVIEAKRRSREDALEGVFTSAGPNYRVPEGYKRSAPRDTAQGAPQAGAPDRGAIEQEMRRRGILR